MYEEKTREKKVTIKHIAEKAGVSMSTVSRALRNDPAASAKTRERIHQIARQLHYYPNLLAKGLRQDRTHTIGIIFNDLNKNDKIRICRKIGTNIARLHNKDIIHGDITTSNMILYNNKIHFIDFGLGEKNSEVETKGVDLHVLMEAMESTHSLYSSYFKYVLEGYKEELKNDANIVIKKIEEIVKRGRYR